ncbi:MAG TPA: hypothetical protein VF712_18670 [Thermoleophilaceae bacterium]
MQPFVAYDPASSLPPTLPAQMLQPRHVTRSYAPLPAAYNAPSETVPVKPVEPVEGPSVTERILDFLVAQQQALAERERARSASVSVEPEPSALTASDLVGASFAEVEAFCEAVAPAALRQLRSAYQRLTEGDTEALTHCATSCRRALKTIADGVFPPQSTPHIDRAGQEREVGEQQHLNRLLAFVDVHAGNRMSRKEMTALSATLDALHATACKGVHDEVDKREAEQTLLRTYLVLDEVRRAHAVS